MVHDQRSALSAYLSGLLSAGRVVFTGSEAAEALHVGRGAFLDAAERLQKRKSLLNPRQDFYVVVPPQFAAWGAPPPPWYIDSLMRHIGEAYYVGLLKAAELHGATHQAVMEFQIISAARLPAIRAGRNLLAFYYRKDMAAVAAGIEDRKTDTGVMRISSPALTALDLLRYPRAAGGLDNLATVLSDLAVKIDGTELATLSRVVERPVIQRLGHLLDRLGQGGQTEALRAALAARGVERWIELDPVVARDPDFVLPVQARDARWHILVRRAPEIDT